MGTTVVKVLIPSKQAEVVQTTQYTATLCRAAIDKFTVTNTGSVNESISVNLVPNGGAAGVSNLIVKGKTIPPANGQEYSLTSVIGHTLEPGDFISTLASSTAVTIRASGREFP